LAKPDKENLRWWHEVGVQLLVIHPVPPPGTKRPYGTKLVEDLASYLSNEKLPNATNTLWLARRLALRFKRWKQLEKFQGYLSIGHVMALLAVTERSGSKSSMEELRDRCVAEGWSVEQLKREVQNDRGFKLASGRLPEPLLAATPAIAVKDLYIAARRWKTYHQQCLAGPRSVLKHARRADYSAILLDGVEDAIQGLEDVQEAVKDELKQLRELARDIKAAL
jgi:hypothetical protein